MPGHCDVITPPIENFLYLTDSEDTLQVINKWIGGGAKLKLASWRDGIAKALLKMY